jgi:hypothetical protein
MSLRLCACVCTYGRPHLLPRIIACFSEQTYQDRWMVILDDGGQYQVQRGDRWELYSQPGRFPSLGAKRNFTVELADLNGADAILPIDDDDLFLPWHFEAAAAALEKAEWSRPSVILAPAGPNDWRFNQFQTGHRDDPTKERMYHPAWALRIETFSRMGGYPADQSGPEDKDLMLRMEAAGVTQADPVELGYRPSYVFCWGHGQNISGLLDGKDTGQRAWAKLARKLEPATLETWTPPFDLFRPAVIPGVLGRPF